jgi:hypothetical protein
MDAGPCEVDDPLLLHQHPTRQVPYSPPMQISLIPDNPDVTCVIHKGQISVSMVRIKPGLLLKHKISVLSPAQLITKVSGWGAQKYQLLHYVYSS